MENLYVGLSLLTKLRLQYRWLRSICPKRFFKKAILKKPEACNLLKKGTLAQVFSREFCEISKNMFSTEAAAEHLQTTASALSSSLSFLLLLISPMFVFRSNSKGFKEFESGISFSLSHFCRFYFLFPCFFLPFSVLFHFFLSPFKLRID